MPESFNEKYADRDKFFSYDFVKDSLFTRCGIEVMKRQIGTLDESELPEGVSIGLKLY